MIAVLLLALGLDTVANAGATEPVDADPADRAAVIAVCARCHPDSAFIEGPRSWARWNDVFQQMAARGATGTDAQLARVSRYFLENLTVVDVNTSPAEELAGVLGLDQETLTKLLEQRNQRRFARLEDLRALAGIDPARLARVRSRLLFASASAAEPTMGARYLPVAELRERIAHLAAGLATWRLPTGPNATVLAVRRTAAGEVEIHDHKDDVFVVQAGQARVLLGGRVKDNHQSAPDEWRGGRIVGGHSYTLRAGDVLWIPAGVPHQLRVPTGARFDYLAFKFDAAPTPAAAAP